jgi:RNA polymerase sigma factor for flagellar operon FliA
VADPPDSTFTLGALWEAFGRTRSEDIRAQLIESYMPLARRIAAKVFSLRIDQSIAFDDYLQYGRVGLMEAVDRYDASRNVSFEAYSIHRIRGAILNGIGHETEVAAQREFWRGRMPERIDSLLNASSKPPERASLQDLIDITVGLALGLVLDPDEGEPIDDTVHSNPYAATELEQISRALRACVQQLPQREREIIEEHYFAHLEFQSIAERLSLTKGRVSQLHARALALLREMLAARSGIDRRL